MDTDILVDNLSGTDSELIVLDVSLDSSNYGSINSLQTYLFVIALSGVLDQLYIIDEINHHVDDLEELLKRKFGVKLGKNGHQLEDIDPKNLTGEHYKITKLKADRTFCSNKVKSIRLELLQKSTFNTLIRCTQDMLDNRDRHLYLETEFFKNKTAALQLRGTLHHYRIYMRTALIPMNETITSLTNQLVDEGLIKETRKRFVHNWENARSEQHDLVLKTKENAKSKAIKYYDKKSSDEKRVHLQFGLYHQMIMTDTQFKIDSWMEKYDNDIEEIDLKIQIKKNKYFNMIEQRQALEQKLMEHEDKIKAWKEFKLARENARLYKEKMTAAAITVQAWWRGLIVRLKLGAFRKKGKKKSTAASDAKKKKK